MKVHGLALVLLLGTLLGGCESAFFPRPRTAPPLGGQRRPLAATIGASAFPFLRDGETSRQEVLDRLGPPHSEYEGGRHTVERCCEIEPCPGQYD